MGESGLKRRWSTAWLAAFALMLAGAAFLLWQARQGGGNATGAATAASAPLSTPAPTVPPASPPAPESASAGPPDAPAAEAAPTPAAEPPPAPAGPAAAAAPPAPAAAAPPAPAAATPAPPPAATPAPASPPAAESPAAASPTPPAAPEPATIQVAGFRSAHFGMTESQVRAAVEKDFRIKPAAIKVAENPIEKTRVLVAVVPDPLPGGDHAQISYVLGYKSRKLIQIGLVWAKSVDRTLTPQRLVADAQTLQAYFRGAGYRADTVSLNVPFAKGVVAFRGSDKDGHATVLILEGKLSRNAAGALVLTEAQQLSLFYSLDPAHPDVAAVARPR